MLIHELHLHKSELGNPYKKGIVIGFSFLVGSLVPLLPYFLLTLKDYPILASLGTSLTFLFVVGAWKGRIVGKSVWRSGIEMLSIGLPHSLRFGFCVTRSLELEKTIQLSTLNAFWIHKEKVS